MKNQFLLIFLALSSLSCGQTSPVIPIATQHAPTKFLSVPATTTTIPINSTPYNYEGDYKDLNFIKIVDINRPRLLRIIFTINPVYFKDLNEFNVIHSNSNYRLEDGVYYQDARRIDIFDDGYSDNKLKQDMLHELKHHYCATVMHYQWTTVEESHLGCFLNTPIDKEFGFIK